jgi:hypothetical protein
MGMSRRDRIRPLGRRDPFREPKSIILVICEGQCTEPQYLTGLKRACRNSRVFVKIADEHGTPYTLVDAARQVKRKSQKRARYVEDEHINYDHVWCVFDVDSHPKVAEAKIMANANGIRLAVSNPCFELWLLLHFRDNPGPQDRATLRDRVEKILKGYDKHVNFEDLSDGYFDAVDRAKRMNAAAKADNDEGRNPTTDVCELTEQIRDGAGLI